MRRAHDQTLTRLGSGAKPTTNEQRVLNEVATQEFIASKGFDREYATAVVSAAQARGRPWAGKGVPVRTHLA